jgi:hypothetical protein
MARPKKEINDKQLEKLISINCSVEEVADFFEVDPRTIQRRFAAALKRGRSLGKVSLKRRMWKTAMTDNKGTVSMQIFLSKQMLGYRDRFEETVIHSPPRETKAMVLSFNDFCVAAGYPTPYPKQIEMMEFGTQEEVARLLLGARGYGKTDYVVILGLAYKLYLDPKFTSLIITKSDQRNAAMIREIAEILKKHSISLEKQNSTEVRLAGLIGKDNSVSAVTVGTSSLRGRHPKLVVMDDPVTEEDVSEATRKRVQRVYNEVSKLCTNVLVIGQPVHKHDLYESLRPLLKRMEVPHGSIPELDHDLEAQRLAGVDEASIQASYFLRVISEGSTPFDKVKSIDQFPQPGTAVAFIDPSDGGNDTAVSIFKQYGQGIAVVGFSWKRAWHHCLEDLTVLFKKYTVARVCFETNKHGQQPLDVLRAAFKDIGVVGRNSNTNKHSRIMAAGTFAHLIHIAKESNKNYIDQVTKYELGVKVDDAPDSLATGLEWIGLIKGKQ